MRKLRTLRSNKCINLINYSLAPRAIEEQVLQSFLKEYCTRLRKNKERFVGTKDTERLVGMNQSALIDCVLILENRLSLFVPTPETKSTYGLM